MVTDDTLKMHFSTEVYLLTVDLVHRVCVAVCTSTEVYLLTVDLVHRVCVLLCVLPQRCTY